MVEFDRIPIPFSEQALFCTNKLYCVMSSPSVLVRCDSGFVQIVFNFFSDLVEHPSGFMAVKNTDCLSLLRLFPPGTSPLLIMECISKAFPMW